LLRIDDPIHGVGIEGLTVSILKEMNSSKEGILSDGLCFVLKLINLDMLNLLFAL
jgi:hypothetical protein